MARRKNIVRSRNSFSRRLLFLGLLCALPMVGICWRMYSLSVVQGARMRNKVSAITCGETIKMAYRGPILDRNGAALATSVQAYRVSRSGRDYRYAKGDADLLAPLLGMPAKVVAAKLRSRKGRFVWLAKGISVDAANAIERSKVRGIGVHIDQLRSYPHGPLAAHVVGFSGVDAQGLEGVELALDDKIRGKPVSVHVCSDARGRTKLDAGDLAGVNQGDSVELTLDATLQSIAERELTRRITEVHAQAGSVVILDPRSGEVLALANRPVFDPNRYASFEPATRRDRAVTDLFDPGSTTKPLLVAGAMEEGVVTPSSRFDCEHGSMRIGGRTIHDHKPYDILDVADILRVSSNICSAKIGAKLGADKFHDYLQEFGFGRRTGIDLPGESGGMLRPAAKWRPIDLANISFGQGVSVTALQLASAFSVLAADGVRRRPFIVSRVVDADGRTVVAHRERKPTRVVSARVARSVTHMLEAVVSPQGTAPRAAIEGMRVAGKTGTAQKVVDGAYSRHDWVASFVGYLPADDPKVVIAVVIDEPRLNHYGGIVSAPVFKRIAEAGLDYLHIDRRPVERSPAEPVSPLPVQQAAAPARWRVKGAPTSIRPGDSMPDMRGLSLRTAMRALGDSGCDIRVQGAGYVLSQRPAAGKILAPGTAISFRLGVRSAADSGRAR